MFYIEKIGKYRVPKKLKICFHIYQVCSYRMFKYSDKQEIKLRSELFFESNASIAF